MSILTEIKKYVSKRKIHKLNTHAQNYEHASIALQREAVMYQEKALSLRIEAAALSRQTAKIVRKK